MDVEYECGCKLHKKLLDKSKLQLIQHQRCKKHPWATVAKMECKELDTYYTSKVL